MGTSKTGNDDVSAVRGRDVLGRSMTTLNVFESMLWERAWSLMVEKECERAWCEGRASDVDWVTPFTFTAGVGLRAGVRAGVGVRDPEGALSCQPLLGRRGTRPSGARLSGGVMGGKTKGAGGGRVRGVPVRATGLKQ